MKANSYSAQVSQNEAPNRTVNRQGESLYFGLQRSYYLLQVRFESCLILQHNARRWQLGQMATTASGASGPPGDEALDMMHLQIRLMPKRQKWSRSATPFTLSASPSEGVEFDPTRFSDESRLSVQRLMRVAWHRSKPAGARLLSTSVPLIWECPSLLTSQQPSV